DARSDLAEMKQWRVAWAHADLARVAARRGDVDRAISLYEHAIAQDGTGVSFYHLEVALLHEKQGDYRAALPRLSAALETLDPDVSVDFRTQLETKRRTC